MRDETMPDGKWEFNADVASVFGDMLSRSIPGLSDLRNQIKFIVAHTMPLGGSILEIGCSDGQQIESIKELEDQISIIKIYGIDNSQEMLEIADEKCGDYAKLMNHDISKGMPRFIGGPLKYDLILCVLTLQFIPVELRPKILKFIKNSIRNGGRFIFVEKVIFPDDDTQTLMTKVYHAIKMQNGYTLEQVVAKNESLRNVLVSQTIESNEQMLKAAGFTSVSTFWQNTAFVGWVAS